MLNPTQLLNNLAQFTGTTQWFKHPLFSKFRYTDGVRYLAVKAECYWLLEFIFSHQIDASIKDVPFQVWTITKDGSKATITIGDGNDNLVKTFNISYTSFPLDTYTLWLVDGVLLLKSEY